MLILATLSPDEEHLAQDAEMLEEHGAANVWLT